MIVQIVHIFHSPMFSINKRKISFADTGREQAIALAEGFEQSEQLKILFLSQLWHLQKSLQPKLNQLGMNQISR